MVLRPRMDTFSIHTDLLFESKSKTFLKDTSIVVDSQTGLITKLYKRKDALPAEIHGPDVDLRGKTVMSGFVDAHTHIFLHAYSETSSLNQMLHESLVERVCRATQHCRAALMAGYTTYRDLGTEGAFDADVHVRDSINRGLIPGPRIFCATEALASSGGYEIRVENRIGGLDVPRISDPCDGVDGVRAAVRRRIGAGADVIKFYGDYRKRALRFPASAWGGCPDVMFPPDKGGIAQNERSPSILLFNQDEMNAIVAEAKVARAPVAAHCATAEAVTMAANAGVTSVEHGNEPMEGTGAMKSLKDNGTIFVPTLAVMELYMPMKPVLAQVKKCFDMGVKIACGGDTGAFAHGDNAREIELLLQAGIPLEDALSAATFRGWEACGGDWSGRRFGWLGEGCAADIIALEGDVRNDCSSLRKVDFVMKDGRVLKANGRSMM